MIERALRDGHHLTRTELAERLQRARLPDAGPRLARMVMHAELEGMRLAPVFDQLVAGWKAQGWEIGPVRAQYEAVEPMALPRCEVGLGTIAGRTGTLLTQSDEFLAGVDFPEAA